MNLRALLTTSLMALLLLVAACGQNEEGTEDNEEGNDTAANDQEITIKVANYFAEDHPQNIALKEKFKPLVEENTDGQVTVEIYPNNELGDESQFTSGVRNGTIEMAIVGMGLQTANPKIGAVEWPFLFNDYEHANSLLNGEIGEEIEPLFRELGTEPLAWTANGFRVVSSDKPVKSMEDFEGLRLRMPNIPIFINTGEAMGANIQPLAFSEVFTALEQGVINGQDNPYATLYASGWYEVQSHVLETNHMFSPNAYLMNKEFFDGLDQETQDIIVEAANEAAQLEWELAEEAEIEVKQQLEEAGLEITVPSDDFRQQLVDSMDPVYQDLYKEFDWAEEFIGKIRNAE
ncbi:TRAP transporter substrate-binding protein [Aquibacillus albus]|uniref:Tripartite ATP-independent transporter DctP family solute receptor n=1 Tax=Aquibacillus albus TaxID=1168171 RepID=A0ABS2N638_9BACI|nr:TRAP transporter substrate-binding protein [Aquibacillus albus]MBM7573587.1 tripartite ATP-independent transporter DctP family solute receptor [Aquibacillus albus]